MQRFQMYMSVFKEIYCTLLMTFFCLFSTVLFGSFVGTVMPYKWTESKTLSAFEEQMNKWTESDETISLKDCNATQAKDQKSVKDRLFNK